jgi:hypothetical protein
LKQGLLKVGVPEDYANFLNLIFGFLREGYSQTVTDNVAAITGKQPRSLSQYVNDYQKSWIQK